MSSADPVRSPPITVLGSGVALGVYLPALLVQVQLERRDLAAETLVIESLYRPEALDRLRQHKVAYHRNFALALMAQRAVRGDVGASLDPELRDALLERWRVEDRRRFLVWSGFWMPILDAYRRLVYPRRLAIDICRIDAIPSASFRSHRRLRDDEREIWLWHGLMGRIEHEIPVGDRAPTPWAERAVRLVVHGGGWGMGTYRQAIPELEARGFTLDIVGYEDADLDRRSVDHRYFRVDPDYSPWIPGPDGRLVFPPFGEVPTTGEPTYRNRPTHHELFDRIGAAQAIVSKPGGGTLIDSLASATPVVLLEPFGDTERANGDLWQRLGYGIWWQAWEEKGFDPEVLEPMHRRLLERHRAPSYPDVVASEALEAREGHGSGVA